MPNPHATDVAASAERVSSIPVVLTIMLLAKAALALAALALPVVATLVGFRYQHPRDLDQVLQRDHHGGCDSGRNLRCPARRPPRPDPPSFPRVALVSGLSPAACPWYSNQPRMVMFNKTFLSTTASLCV